MRYTEQNQAFIEWRRGVFRHWHAGWPLGRISAELATSVGRIYGVLRRTGGIEPAARQRNPRHLTLAEREEISRGLAAGERPSAIAARLGRDRSVISREISRNGGRTSYRAADAERRAWDQARRPKETLLSRDAILRQLVARKLRRGWSPQQISGWLECRGKPRQEMRISHETIYKTLFVQARGELKRELTAYLRTKRRMRRTHAAGAMSGKRGQIVDAVSIRQRPAEAEDRAVAGHWEGDLLHIGNNVYVATLVERRSRYVLLVRVASKHTEVVVKALARKIRTLPTGLIRTLTWDRGLEMADHKALSIAAKVEVYFCDPSSPWQRGSNENTNGLLRQYLPKGEDCSSFSQAQLDRIADRLNTRPRKTLGYKTPAETLQPMLH
jgi:IS30 family transposase